MILVLRWLLDCIHAISAAMRLHAQSALRNIDAHVELVCDAQAALMDTTDSGVGSKASHIKHQAFLPPSGTTWGVLELGGASMQVTFMQPQGLDMPNKDGKGKKGGSSGSRHDATIAFPGAHRNLSLYTHSFLGYGVAVAFDNMTRTAEKAGSNPCMPTG